MITNYLKTSNLTRGYNLNKLQPECLTFYTDADLLK